MHDKPSSLAGRARLQSVRALGCAERDAIILTEVVNDRGESHILSRYGDQVWELWPLFTQASIQPARKRIDWSRAPTRFREPCKAVFYRYLIAGIPGWAPPNANTLARQYTCLVSFLRYLEKLAVPSLSSVQPLHVQNFLHELREAGVSESTIAKYRVVIALLYHLRDEHEGGLILDPWPDDSIGGRRRSRGDHSSSARTPLIPRDVVSRLFAFAEGLLKRADALLDERDCGIRKPNNDDVLRLRDACFFLLGLLTGMRCDELAGIEVNAGRTETKDGVTYNWVRSIEHKTKKGPVEYLMPSMGHEILRVMERWSAPLRVRLLQQLAVWEADRSEHGVAERLRRISAARADANRLFLRMPRSRAGIGTVSGIAWHGAMREFATAAGIEWQLAPHQLRRTYAWMFVRHRLGNMLFLKEQFKHSSVLMTQLYAANPRQDGTLYDELRDEMRSLKVDLIQHWLSDDVKLSGGAGRRIVALRANTFSDRKELIEETAETVRIRSNGHAWCLAQDDGCGGAGLYERSMRWMQQWMHRRLPCRHLERDLPTPS